MESARWLVLSPILVALAAGALAPGRTAGALAGDRSWDPPPCPPEAPAPPGAGAWYRLDPRLDRSGTLAGQRLALGTAGAPARVLELPPESFASGPVGGLVLVGEDDGVTSRLRLVDPARACAIAVAEEAAVVRSAIVEPGGGAAYEHRVDRASRTDLGIWRRTLPTGEATRVLDGLAPDPRLGRTFVTDLVTGSDGRLAVSSCTPTGCRVRVLEPAGGAVDTISGTGPAVGVAASEVLVRAACDGWPCDVQAVSPGSGARRTLVAGAYAVASAGGHLVAEVAGGRLSTIDVASGRVSDTAGPGAVPMRSGSTATAGAEGPPGWIVLARQGRPDPGTMLQLELRTGAVRWHQEDAR